MKQKEQGKTNYLNMGMMKDLLFEFSSRLW